MELYQGRGSVVHNQYSSEKGVAIGGAAAVRADVQNEWFVSVRYSPRTKGNCHSRPSAAALVVVVSTRNERRMRES